MYEIVDIFFVFFYSPFPALNVKEELLLLQPSLSSNAEPGPLTGQRILDLAASSEEQDLRAREKSCFSKMSYDIFF